MCFCRLEGSNYEVFPSRDGDTVWDGEDEVLYINELLSTALHHELNDMQAGVENRLLRSRYPWGRTAAVAANKAY